MYPTECTTRDAADSGLRELPDSDRNLSSDFDDKPNGGKRPFVNGQIEQVFRLVDALLAAIDSAGDSDRDRSQETIHVFTRELNATKVAVISTDLYGNVIYCNHHFVELWEIPPAILLTRKHSQYVAYCRQRLKDPTAWLAKSDQICLRDGRRIEQVFQTQRANGKAVGQTWAYRAVTEPGSIQNRSAEPCTSSSAGATVSRREVLTDWLKRECSWLKNTDAAVFALYDQQVFAANSVAESITGYCQTEMVTLPQFKEMAARFGRMNEDVAASRSIKSVHSFTALGSRGHNEFRLTTKSGKDCWLKFTVQKQVVDSKCLCLLSAIDVTELRQQAASVRDLVAIGRNLTQQRSQLIAEITHQSLGALNLISMSADLLETYGDRWSPHKKQTYNTKIRDGIIGLSAQLRRMEKVAQLNLDHLALYPSEPLRPLALELFEPEKVSDPLAADCIDVHRICYHLVEAFKAKYRQHAFVTFCLATEPKARINQLYFQSVLSHLIDALTLPAAASLVKVIVNLHSDSLVVRVYNTRFNNLSSEKLSQPAYLTTAALQSQVSSGNASIEPAHKDFNSKLLVVESLVNIFKGLVTVEHQQEHTVATVELSLSTLSKYS